MWAELLFKNNIIKTEQPENPGKSRGNKKTNKMKNLLTTLSFILTAFSISAFGQDIKASEPDFAYQVAYVAPDGSSSSQVESQVPKAKVFYNVFHITANGSKSSTRITQQDSPRFIVNMGGNDRDISGIVQVFKMEQSKDSRKCDYPLKNPSGNANYISFTFKKFGKSSYIITLTGKLVPGEYMVNIFLDDARTISLFGID